MIQAERDNASKGIPEIERVYSALREAKIKAAAEIREELGKLGKGITDGTKEIMIADFSTEDKSVQLVYEVEQNSLTYRTQVLGCFGETFYGNGDPLDYGVILYKPPRAPSEKELTAQASPGWWIDYGQIIAAKMQKRIAEQEGEK